MYLTFYYTSILLDFLTWYSKLSNSAIMITRYKDRSPIKTTQCTLQTCLSMNVKSRY